MTEPTRGQKGYVMNMKDIKDRCILDADCWLWALRVGKHGHPNATIGSKYGRLVRRHVMELDGRLKNGNRLVVGDTCGNRTCCNPAHLRMTSRKMICREMWGTTRFADSVKFRELAVRRGGTKIGMDEARAIRRECSVLTAGERSKRIGELAEKYSVVRSAITKLLNNETWREPANSVFALGMAA